MYQHPMRSFRCKPLKHYADVQDEGLVTWLAEASRKTRMKGGSMIAQFIFSMKHFDVYDPESGRERRIRRYQVHRNCTV